LDQLGLVDRYHLEDQQLSMPGQMVLEDLEVLGHREGQVDLVVPHFV
jgi:hypothetical protein